MSHYRVSAWTDDNGRKDHVVLMTPTADDFERRMWGHFRPTIVADCSESEHPEENAMLIVRALNFLEAHQ